MSTDKPHHLHHYESPEHQYSTAKQGVWVFMATEILMFGGLFVAYALYKNIYPEIFVFGSSLLDWRMGALNTVVLIASSLTMALGIHYIQKKENTKAFWNLILTVVCGLIFMVVKYFEYSHKFHEHIFPGKHFAYAPVGVDVPVNQGLYFSLYFMMTGLHGTHVLIGMGMILWVAIKTRRGDFGPHYYTPVEGVGIFWHLVDLIWIYLFPLLYLVG
ncbi:MAG: cytochrome c oxidase subunit 3 family protein [Pseudomonadota bacterium]|nr:cytochrome c oxidase subunit 3 family protein [Pseudomonadota bacterium]